MAQAGSRRPGSQEHIGSTLRRGAARALRALDDLWDALFGVVNLMTGLAVLANIPVLQVASLAISWK